MPTPSGSTAQYGFPYLLETDVPDVATASQDLAQAVENVLKAMRVGKVEMWATATAPTGSLLCQGQAVSRTTYAALFAAIGTTYGVGDGSTTFNLPDFRGRMPMGAGSGPGLTVRTLGPGAGAESQTLTVSQIPSMTPTITSVVTDGGHAHASSSGYDFVYGSSPSSTIFTNQGTNVDHSPAWNLGGEPATASVATGVTVASTSSAVGTVSNTAVPTVPPFTVVNVVIWYA